jgi:hypothetical protein
MIKKSSVRTAISLSAAFAVLALPGDARAQTYEFVRIGADPGPQQVNSANAINDAGFVAGAMWTGSKSVHAYVWSLSGGVNLQKQVKGQGYGAAYALNDHLQVGGTSGKFEGAFGVVTVHATGWLGADPIVVGDTKKPNSYVYGMNNHGWMVGWQANMGACLYRVINGRASRTSLGFDSARDVNNHGVVVGHAYNPVRAIRWTSGSGIELVPDMLSAWAINDLGMIVGTMPATVHLSTGSFLVNHAAIHHNGITSTIEMPQVVGVSYYQASAHAISESGRFIVGKATARNEARQIIFTDGFLHDRQTGVTTFLTDLAPGRIYYEVNGVNSSGHIVGSTQNPNGSYSAFILLRQGP